METTLRRSWTMLSAVAATFAIGCSPCGGEADRIAALVAGETLVLDGACVIRQSVTVPAGATVQGAHFALEGDAHVVLEPSADASVPTTLRDVTVTGGASAAEPGGYAIGVMGPGHARVVGGTLDIERGAAIASFGATLLIDGVTLRGNVVPEEIVSLPDPPDATRFATYAIAAFDGATVTVSGGSSARFARAGLACRDATLVARDTVLTEHVGTAILAFGCDVTLERVEITGTLATPRRAAIGLGTDMSTVSALDLHVHDAAGFGAFLTRTDATFTSPVLERLSQAGLWAENGATLEVSGGTFDANRGTGIAAVGAASLTVRDTMVSGTSRAPIPTASGLSADTMADGLHVEQTADLPLTLSLDGVMVTGSERIGLLIDGGDAALSPTIADVTVEPAGVALGAVAQNVMALPVTWDDGITRVGTDARDLAAAELAISGGDPLGILMPPTLMP